jgi:hypothetical protein
VNGGDDLAARVVSAVMSGEGSQQAWGVGGRSGAKASEAVLPQCCDLSPIEPAVFEVSKTGERCAHREKCAV